MKGKILSILVLCALQVMISSCKDDDEKPSKAVLLTARSWSISKIEVNGNDETSNLEPCDTDNVFTFNSDGTIILDIGEIMCDETEDISGTWRFKTNETIINIHINGEVALDWKILELTASTFKISNSDLSVSRTITFSAK